MSLFQGLSAKELRENCLLWEQEVVSSNLAAPTINDYPLVPNHG
jgi:hypothetical protein